METDAFKHKCLPVCVSICRVPTSADGHTAFPRTSGSSASNSPDCGFEGKPLGDAFEIEGLEESKKPIQTNCALRRSRVYENAIMLAINVMLYQVSVAFFSIAHLFESDKGVDGRIMLCIGLRAGKA